MSAAFVLPSVVVPDDIWVRCKISASAHGLTPTLLAALAWKESGFNQYAWNPEPRYPYLFDVRTGAPFRLLTEEEVASAIPPSDFPALRGDRDQEWNAQRASWGICQVMGAVARELGFRCAYLTELVKVDLNIELAAKHLARQIARFGTAADGLSAYNSGHPVDSNRGSYVLPILRVADAIRTQVAEKGV